MVWLVILLILLVAFGPLLWLRPGPRERRLARLRQQAYREGMRVELRRLPGRDLAARERVTASGKALDTTRECAAYVLPLPVRLRRLPRWRILRGEAGMRALPGWSFEPGRRPDHPRLAQMFEALAGVVAGLPDDVVALECEPLGIAGYWLEGPGTSPERVSDLARRLGDAGRLLADLDARLQAEEEPGNI